MKNNIHSAIESDLGYYYQGMYALVILLQSQNDEAKISLETNDDIYVEGEYPTLYQIKHRSKERKSLTIKSVDLWKTLLIWFKETNKVDSKFVLVTCDYLEDDSILLELTKEKREISEVKEHLLQEAERVVKERREYEEKVEKGEIKKQKEPPHEKRINACKMILGLKMEELDYILNNAYILHSEFKIDRIEEKISSLVSSIIPKQIRSNIVQRLLEWWNYRCVKSMIRSEYTHIDKCEVQAKMVELITQEKVEKFPLINVRPNEDEIDKFRANNLLMLKQIDLINGEEIRKKKALLNSWKASNQRAAWIKDDLSKAFDLEEYENELIEVWEYRFNMIKSKVDYENNKVNYGLELYDWIYDSAKDDIDTVDDNLQKKYIVHGTYQILANVLKVGWHGDYKKILEEENNADI